MGHGRTCARVVAGLLVSAAILATGPATASDDDHTVNDLALLLRTIETELRARDEVRALSEARRRGMVLLVASGLGIPIEGEVYDHLDAPYTRIARQIYEHASFAGQGRIALIARTYLHGSDRAARPVGPPPHHSTTRTEAASPTTPESPRAVPSPVRTARGPSPRVRSPPRLPVWTPMPGRRSAPRRDLGAPRGITSSTGGRRVWGPTPLERPAGSPPRRVAARPPVPTLPSRAQDRGRRHPGGGHRIGPGDLLRIHGLDHPPRRRPLTRTVNRAGGMVLPTLGVVRVAGLTALQVEERLANAARRRGRGVRPRVDVARIRSRKIFVVGEVGQIGPIPIGTTRVPLADVLARVGGLRRTADPGRIQVTRAGRRFVVDIRPSGNRPGGGAFFLEPGDRVTVPRRPAP